MGPHHDDLRTIKRPFYLTKKSKRDDSFGWTFTIRLTYAHAFIALMPLFFRLLCFFGRAVYAF
jgi:hypothetical protein